MEVVHQAPGADNPYTHAGAGPVPSFENGIEGGDTGAGIDHACHQKLRRRPALDVKIDPAAACVSEGVAGDLRDCGGQAGLVLHVEPE